MVVQKFRLIAPFDETIFGVLSHKIRNWFNADTETRMECVCLFCLFVRLISSHQRDKKDILYIHAYIYIYIYIYMSTYVRNANFKCESSNIYE